MKILKRLKTVGKKILFSFFARIALIAIFLPIVLFGVFLSTFDVNDYRQPLENLAFKKVGRQITLNGTIKWSFSLAHGFSLLITDVDVANPPWASRPLMARVGSVKLHLDVLSLLSQRLNIIAFELQNTDVQMESDQRGNANWIFEPLTISESKNTASESKEPIKPTAKVAIDVKEVIIADSRLGFKTTDGKVRIIDIPTLSFHGDGEGIAIHFKGVFTGVPAELALTAGTFQSVFDKNWPINLRVSYGLAVMDAKGTLDYGKNALSLSHFDVKAGSSNLFGNLDFVLKNKRPYIKGRIDGNVVQVKDFQLTFVQAEKTSTKIDSSKQVSVSESQAKSPLFPSTPISFDGLKSLDTDLDISISSLVWGLTTFEQLKTKIELKDGKLAISPITATIAGSEARANLVIDSSVNEPQLFMNLLASEVDLSQVMQLGGVENIISGITHVDIDIKTSGVSAHDFAAHANGKINLLMDTGTLSSSGLRDLASGLLDMVAPRVSRLVNPGVNCMAARYEIHQGLMDTKGFLLDTDMTTLSSTGYINLPDEHLSLNLYTRPKSLGLESMIPPMRILGNIKSPKFMLQTSGTVQKLTGLIMNRDTTGDNVPTLVEIKGQNTCAATLDHPELAPVQVKSTLVPRTTGNLTDKVKDIGGSLLKGLGNHFLGK